MFLPKRKLIALLFLSLLALLILTLSFKEAPYTLRTVSLDIAKAPLCVTTFLASEARALFLFHNSYWQNLRLKQENDRLKSALLAFQENAGENERLKTLLDFKAAFPHETKAARVIGKDFGVVKSYLILDRGSADGVKKYAPVLTPGGLVGKVLEVGRHVCKVILINDPDLSIPALDIRTREQGLVSGTLDGRSKLRFLDLDSGVAEGDIIATSGLNMTYPEGIVLGRVRWIGVESSGMGKFAVLEPAVRPGTLEEVLIVLS